jgi:hypothetical protein
MAWSLRYTHLRQIRPVASLGGRAPVGEPRRPSLGLLSLGECLGWRAAYGQSPPTPVDEPSLASKVPPISSRVRLAPLPHPLLQFLVQLLLDFRVLLLLLRSQKRVDLFVAVRNDFPQLAPAFQGPRTGV